MAREIEKEMLNSMLLILVSPSVKTNVGTGTPPDVVYRTP